MKALKRDRARRSGARSAPARKRGGELLRRLNYAGGGAPGTLKPARDHPKALAKGDPDRRSVIRASIREMMA